MSEHVQTCIDLHVLNCLDNIKTCYDLSENPKMKKYTKIEKMVHEMFCTDDDKAIPWTASTSERSKIEHTGDFLTKL